MLLPVLLLLLRRVNMEERLTIRGMMMYKIVDANQDKLAGICPVRFIIPCCVEVSSDFVEGVDVVATLTRFFPLCLIRILSRIEKRESE